jgi:hypothetical protein
MVHQIEKVIEHQLSRVACTKQYFATVDMPKRHARIVAVNFCLLFHESNGRQV